MVLTKKQDNGDKKKEQGKKEPGPKESAGKGSPLNKDKKEAVKKEIAKKEPKKDQPVKKEKINYIEQVRKFVKGAYNELKKVTWPGRKTVIIYTAVVVVAVLFVGALIWIFDSALSTVMKSILNR